MYSKIKISKVSDVHKISELLVSPIEKHQWIFRGHRRSNCDIVPSLERIAEIYLDFQGRKERENRIITHFQRRAHLYISNLPHEEDIIEWLAIIQHYGGPTRLVDFTYSFYIATFFAVEEADDETAIWALRKDCIPQSAFDANLDKSITINDLLDPQKTTTPKKGIIFAEPKRLNERMSIQKGTFICQTDISSTFKENICQTLNYNPIEFDDKNAVNLTVPDLEAFKSIEEFPSLIKFTIPYDIILPEIIRDLDKMNINSNTLFPGLEGFARSLRIYLHY